MIALVKLLAELGLAVPDVLRMATLNAAIRLQRNDLGLVAAGRNADLVVFDNLTDLNPTLRLQRWPAGRPPWRHSQTLRACRWLSGAARYHADPPAHAGRLCHSGARTDCGACPLQDHQGGSLHPVE